MNLWMPYTQMKTAASPLRVAATEGAYLILDDGRRLIDGLASWWTACHGYNHPHLAAAVRKQLDTMPHVMMGGITHEPARRLAARLSGLLPGDLDHVFFSDSGSVAVEVSMKMAVQFWLNQGVLGRNRFVSFHHAYHGDTTGAMSLCDPINSMHSHFKGYLLEQYPSPIPQTEDEQRGLDQFLAAHRKELAGVVIEPLIQGAGGMKFHSAETLASVANLARKHGLLLIADEIATGFGRTGTLFACEQAEVVPDILCVGKALTGGTIGMAATVATDHVFNAFFSDEPQHALMHGPTFMGNPLACAAANASLDLFESEPRMQQAQAIESHFRESLESCRQLKGVVDVRAKGAVAVIQVEQLDRLEQLKSGFMRRGVWLRPFGNMIYATPPLNISATELTTLTDAIVKVTTDWSQGAA